LDTSEFRRVGGTKEVRVDVRVLAATNRDLSAMAGKGLFRGDLYYRMSTITLKIPPLRERDGDIGLLANRFVAVLNERFGSRKRIGEAALQALRNHAWPGNVRELLHAVEAAMVVCEGDEILPAHLPPAIGAPTVVGRTVQPADGARLPTLEELERTHVRLALEASGGHRGNAARILGISERNLYRKLRELGLPS
jgi:DNA-binding NtrC family response regulator